MTVQDDKAINQYFLIMIITTVIFMIIFAYMGLRIHNEETCKRYTYTAYEGKQLEDGDILNNAGDYFLQLYVLSNKNLERFAFCYTLNTNTATGLQISAINEELTSLSTDYVTNGTKKYCTELNADLMKPNGYIGIKCNNCNSSNNITIQKEITGSIAKQIYNHNEEITVQLTETTDYMIQADQSCRRTMRFYLTIYMVVMLIISLITLLIFGVKQFENNIFKGW